MFEILNAEISLLGIVLAAIANMALGMFWFNPKVFGSYWMSLVGKKVEELEGKPQDYFFSILKALITATGLAFLISYVSQINFSWNIILVSIFVSFFVWVSFILMGSLNPVIWEGRNKNLYFLNMSHELVSTLLMGLIVALV